MKSELEQAISTLKFRDDTKDKYVYDITASRRIGNDIDTIDLVMKQTGVETFKRTVDYAKENEFDSIELIMYTNKSAKKKIGTFHIPLGSPQELAGTEVQVQQQPTENNADKYFGAFGGLAGFMNETRTQIGNQLDLQYAKRDLSKAEAQIVALESKNETLAAANENLREQIKVLKDQVHDLERDMGYQKQNYDQRSNMLQLVTNGVVGFVGSQLGVTPDKISSLLGIGTDTATDTETAPAQPAQSSQDLGVQKDERQQYIDAIVDWLYSLDENGVKMIAAVCQYAGQSTVHLARVAQYCQILQNQNNEKEGSDGTN